MQQISWLDQLEQARPEYLDRAREVAFRLLRDREFITIDDVRKECPPPADVDPRILGAVLKAKCFRPMGYIASTRTECHKRPICKFGLREET